MREGTEVTESAVGYIHEPDKITLMGSPSVQNKGLHVRKIRHTNAANAASIKNQQLSKKTSPEATRI